MGWVWHLESSLAWGYLCYTEQLDISGEYIVCVCILFCMFVILLLVKHIPKL